MIGAAGTPPPTGRLTPARWAEGVAGQEQRDRRDVLGLGLGDVGPDRHRVVAGGPDPVDRSP
ncbi:hypothetical protein [Streptomyces sp. NPDC127119]|uniref:hypothetical protein n=1 Tax=Streptomyces sp. NPDC127119 TaxID=3345370 RepID=UPI003630F452